MYNYDLIDSIIRLDQLHDLKLNVSCGVCYGSIDMAGGGQTLKTASDLKSMTNVDYHIHKFSIHFSYNTTNNQLSPKSAIYINLRSTVYNLMDKLLSNKHTSKSIDLCELCVISDLNKPLTTLHSINDHISKLDIPDAHVADLSLYINYLVMLYIIKIQTGIIHG